MVVRFFSADAFSEDSIANILIVCSDIKVYEDLLLKIVNNMHAKLKNNNF